MSRPPDPGKKRQIITAAMSQFSRKGYAGTTIAEVAQAAAIGKGTIYEYFRSKADLFFATFQFLMADTENRITTVAQTATGPVGARLTAIADAVIALWLKNLHLYGLILEFWSATAASPDRQRFKAEFRSGYAQGRRLVAELIENGIRSGEFKANIDATKIAAALIGSWDALLLQGWLDQDFDPVEASRNHMAVVLTGLRTGCD